MSVSARSAALFDVFNFCLCLQVFTVLDQEFADCPWPVPPSAILKFLPIDEDPVGTPKRRNSEAVLRAMLGKDKRFKLSANWEFKDVGGQRPPAT